MKLVSLGELLETHARPYVALQDSLEQMRQMLGGPAAPVTGEYFALEAVDETGCRDGKGIRLWARDDKAGPWQPVVMFDAYKLPDLAKALAAVGAPAPAPHQQEKR